MPEQPMVRGIDAFMIYAQDPAALSEWYATHLGIQTVLEEDGNYYGDVIDDKTDKATHIGIYPAPTGSSAGDARPVMVNYRVDDFDGFVTGLRARGVEIESIVDESFGRFAYFRDGEGNRIEIWSPAR